MRLNVLVALTILCMYIQAFLLFHQKTVRDYQYIFLMSFFLLVSACAQNPEPVLGLVVPFFILAIVWAFGMLQIRKDATAVPDLPIGVLLSRTPKDRFVPSEGTVPQEQPRIIGGNLVSYLALTAACCFVLSLAIFALTPRMEVGMLGGSDLNLSPPEATNTVNLRQGGRIGSSQEPVLRARFPEEPDGKYDGELYWRVTTLNRYRGSRWDRVPVDEENFGDRARQGRRSGEGESRSRREPSSQRLVTQEIYLDDPPPYGVPCLSMPQWALSSNAQLDWDRAGDSTVIARRKRNSALDYNAISNVSQPDPEELRQCPDRYASLRRQRGFVFVYQRVMDMRSYATLTQESLSDEIRALARELTDPYDNPYDQAQAIMRWFDQPDFIYTLTLQPPGDVDPVDHFLLQSRAGHCELYASAMALMIRSIGIPARVVSGYRGGEWIEGDGAYIVRKSMAHLWVEVYFVDHGWVIFDPTPESDFPELRIGAFSRFMSRNILKVKMMWFRDIVGYSGGIRLADLRNLSLGLVWFDFDLVRDAFREPIFSGIVPRAVFWLTVLGAIPTFVVLLFARRPVRTGSRISYTPDQVRATRLFGQLKRRLRRLGMDCTGKSAGEVFQSLEGDLLEHAGAIEEVVQTYREARFGGRPLSRRRYVELDRAIRSVRKPRHEKGAQPA
jgi:transglutaminase-like putative cysteine protease